MPKCKYCGRFLNPNNDSIGCRVVYSDFEPDHDEYWHKSCEHPRKMKLIKQEPHKYEPVAFIKMINIGEHNGKI